MIISDSVWKEKMIARLRMINDEAAAKIKEYLDGHVVSTLADWNALIDYAYGVSTAYGEAAAAIACEFYDAVAAASGVNIPPAEPAPVADYHEVAKAIRGTGKSGNPDLMANSIGRLVKMAGVDTTMQNALRDGAEWAWIPSGDTCAFCLMLSSNGWQRASKKAIKNGHAEHVHANCDCTYAVRFDSSTTVAGYDPAGLLALYRNAAGSSAAAKVNAMRRAAYAENKSEINAQKRAAYQARQERKENSSVK